MFKSKVRPLVIPQSEHARLAANIAILWGNREFERPKIAFPTFVRAVFLHDRGYELLDTGAIGELPESLWLEYQRRGAFAESENCVLDLLVMFHVKRLLSYGANHSEARRKLDLELSAKIEQSLRQTDYTAADLQRADTITHLCDNVSFDFCFELPKTGATSVCAGADSDETVLVQHRCEGENIFLSPWPLAVQEASGFIVGYLPDGYPLTPIPVLVPYSLLPG